MDLDRLAAFVAVAEERHFGRAARRLRIAQPPLSRRIQQLESELGVRLFERDRRGVAITAAGAHLLPEARRALAQAQRVAALAAGLRSGEAGQIRLAFVASAAAEVMPRLVEAHRSAHPHVAWRLSAATSADQVGALRSGALDAGLMRPPDARPGLAVLPIRREGLSIILPSTHRLAAAPSLHLGDLRGWPLILYPRADGPSVRDRIVGACQAAGFDPRIAEESGELAATLGLVAAGVGIALVIGTSYGVLPSTLRGRVLEDPEPAWTLALAWDGESPAPAVRRLVETAHALWPAATRA